MSFDSHHPARVVSEGAPDCTRLFDINNSTKMPSQQKRGIYHVTAEAQSSIYPSAILETPGVPSAFMGENSRPYNIRILPTIEQSYYEIDRQEHITSIGNYHRFTPLAWSAINYDFGKAVKIPCGMLRVTYPLSGEQQAASDELCAIIGIHTPPIFSFPPLDPSDQGNRLLKEAAHLEWFADIQDVVERQGKWNELALCKKAQLKIDQVTMPAFINCVPADAFRRHEFFTKTSIYPDTSSSESEGDDFFVRKQMLDIAKEQRKNGVLIYCGFCDGEHEAGVSCSSLTLSVDEEMDELDPSPPSSPPRFNSPVPDSRIPLCNRCGGQHQENMEIEMDSITAAQDIGSPFYSPSSPLFPSTRAPIPSPVLTYPLVDDRSSPAWSIDDSSDATGAAIIAAVQAAVQEHVGMSIDEPIDLTNVPDEITLEEWRAAAALAKFISTGRKGKGKAA